MVAIEILISGMPPHPGTYFERNGSDDATRELTLDLASVNVTALTKRLHLSSRGDDVLLCQEVATPGHAIPAVVFAAKDP